MYLNEPSRAHPGPDRTAFLALKTLI